MEIWAHRGASAYAPENTMEAFRLAIDMKADGIELDVQLSGDGIPVVIHDETLKRVSNGIGYVKDKTMAQLRELFVNKTHPEYAQVQIPTLEEVLMLLLPTSLKLNIELKTGFFFYPGIETKVLELVRQYQMEERVWYSSFNHYTIRRILELCPAARTGLLYSDGLYEPARYAGRLGVAALHPYVRNLQYPDYKEQCEREGLRIHAWTVDSLEDMKQCVQIGADAVITNYPDAARIITQRQAEGRYPFENPFQGRHRSFTLFGAGACGKQFLEQFGYRHRPERVVDNSEEKWGKYLGGMQMEAVRIEPPSHLTPGDCVIIAGRFWLPIAKQLAEMGITNYYIYEDADRWKRQECADETQAAADQ